MDNYKTYTLFSSVQSQFLESCFCTAKYTYRQINQMKFSHAHMLISIYTLLTALDGDGENSMRTGAMFIHVGGTNRS